jgi:hypothetical protein
MDTPDRICVTGLRHRCRSVERQEAAGSLRLRRHSGSSVSPVASGAILRSCLSEIPGGTIDPVEWTGG